MQQDISKKIETFFSTYKMRQYDKGQILTFAGDDPQYVYYLASGTVRKYDVSYRGDEIVVNIFKPGSFFPMSWAINKGPNIYFYQAASPIEVRLADPEDCVKFLKTNPDVMFDLLSRVYNGADGMLKRMVLLMGGSARNRVIFEVLLEGRRFGTEQTGKSKHITIQESELGARAGLTRETVSREMRKLTTEGLIKLENGKIIILDSDALSEKLDAAP